MNKEDSKTKSDGYAKRLANLIPYQIKKGQILNPKGRGKGKDYWAYVSHLAAPEDLLEPMRKQFCLPHGKIDLEKAVILRLVLEAIKGDMKAIELWLDRKYGKVTQPMDISTETGPLVAILNAPQGDQTIRVSTTPTEQKKIIDINPTEYPAAQTNTPPDQAPAGAQP